MMAYIPCTSNSEGLVKKYVGLVQLLPKFGTCKIFANFVPRQKLEIIIIILDKIGSSATSGCNCYKFQFIS